MAIPVSGGLFAKETIDPDNIPYILEILDDAGNEINLEQEQINYEIDSEKIYSFRFTRR